MTQVNAVVNLDINTGQASAHLRALQQQINAFQSSLNTANVAQGTMARQNHQVLSDMTNASRFFTAETMKMRTAASQLDQTLSKGRGTMGQWLGARFAKDGAAASAAMALAHRRAAALQTQFVATGAAANGFQSALAIKPMAAFNSTAAVTNQRLAIQRAMFTQATTSMINFGKNTQWAGRQLMVGFTVPLTMFGVLAGKTFRDLEKEVINFKKVYGDAMTTPDELNKNLAAMKKLSNEFTKYGIAAKDTMALAAQAAAAGAQNADLIDATTEATRLATLGQMEQNEALKTTIALQSAFGLQGKELSKSINFLNMVENQTVVTLQDLAGAIPRVAPVIKGLGGTVEDMAAMLAAMQEGGVSAAQGANALKSGLASLINPSNKAVEALQAVGINIKGIIESNRGDLMGTVKGFANALGTLDKFGQQQSLEKLFGKYQYARLGALFANINKAGTQASKVMDIASLSAEQMAQKANSELNTISDNVATKFTAAMEKFKLAIAPIGELFTKMATPIIGFFTMILEKFNSLPDFAKNFIGLGAVITGIVIPAGTMFLGLLMNLTGTLLKFGHTIGVTFKGFMTGGVKGALAGITQSLQYMSVAEMEAAEAATQLSGSSTAVTRALLAQVGAAEAATAPVLELATAYSILATRMAEASAMASATSPMFVPGQAMGLAKNIPVRRIRRAFGGSIPGTGNSDTVPAMLTPGEFVVNKEATARNLPLLHQINQSKVQNFAVGGRLRPAPNIIIPTAADEAAFAARMRAQQVPQSSGVRTAHPQGVLKANQLSDTDIEWINAQLARAIRDDYGYSGADDVSWLHQLPLGTAALTTEYNQQLRLGRGNALAIAGDFNRPGPDNALAPLFRTRAVGQYLDSMGRPLDDLVGGLRSSFVSGLKGFGGGAMHDSDFYEIAQRAFKERGAEDFFEFLRSRENSGALRSGWNQNLSQDLLARTAARGEGRSSAGIFKRAFGDAYEETVLSGRRASIITLPDGRRVGIASGKTQDRPGYASYQRTGTVPGTDRAHFQEKGFWLPRLNNGGEVFLGMPQSSRETAVALARRAALAKANADMTTGRFSSMPVTNGRRVGDLNSGHSATFVGANGIYEIDGKKYVVKFHDSTDSALLEVRGTHMARTLHGLESPEQSLVKMPHPQTGDLMPGVASLYDKRFASPAGPIPQGAFGAQLAATLFGRNRDTQFDNMYLNRYVDVGAAGLGVDANGNPSAMTSRRFGTPNISAREQLGINLLMKKGGAKRWFAESTAEYARNMSGIQYEAMMRAELAKVRANLPAAMGALPYATAAERDLYTRHILTDLADLDGVDWNAVRNAHASVVQQVAKPPTAAAAAKTAATKMQRLRTLGRGGFGRFGIPFLAKGGLLGNFELDDSSGTNIYRNRYGSGGGMSSFFGRMQPPTVGHQMMMERTLLHALESGRDASIFTPMFGGKDSRSPITLRQRLAAILEATGIRATGTGNAYTIFDALKKAGYSDIARIIGENDMATDSFGKAAKSRGMGSSLIGIPRDLSGVSGTKVREAALSGSLEAMRQAGFIGASPRTATSIMRSIMLHRNAGGAIYQTGDHPIVPGVGSTDTVPAMLTPGEFVINKRATAKNLPLLHALNKGGQHFLFGGMVQGVSSAGGGQFFYTDFNGEQRVANSIQEANSKQRQINKAIAQAHKQNNARGKTAGGGRGMGAGMGMGAIGGALMMAPLLPGVGENQGLSSLAMGGGMAMSMASMLPMLGLGAPAIAAIAGVATVAGTVGFALHKWRDNIDTVSKASADLGANIGGTANAVNNMAKILGTETPAQAAAKMQLGFTSDDKAMLEGEFAAMFSSPEGAKFIEDLKSATSADRFKKLSDYLKSAIATGMMDTKTAQSFARSVGLVLGDAALGTSAASAVRDQTTGVAAMKALADTRKAAADADSGLQELASSSGDTEISFGLAGRAVGAATQIIQDYANVIAMARKEYQDGTISFEQYTAAVNDAKAAQQQYTDVITDAVMRSNDRGGTRGALDAQLIASGMSQEQVDAITHSTDIGISSTELGVGPINIRKVSAYEQEFAQREAMSQYNKSFDELTADEKKSVEATARSNQDIARGIDLSGLNEKIKASVLAGEMTAEQAASFGQTVMYSTEALKALADGASIATTAFIMSANSLEGVNAAQFKSVGAAFGAKGGDIAGLQAYFGGLDQNQRQGALDRFAGFGAVRRGETGRPIEDVSKGYQRQSDFLRDSQSLSSSIGQQAAYDLQGTKAYSASLQSGKTQNISRAFAGAAEGGVAENVIKYVIEYEGVKSADELIETTNRMTENTQKIMSLPEEVVKGLQIDLTLPEDLDTFGPMADNINAKWGILQNLNPNIDMVAQMQFLLLDSNGNQLTAEQTSKNVTAINKAMKDLDSGKKTVEKEAVIKLLSTTMGAGGETLTADQAVEAYQSLVDQFGEQKLVKLPTDVYTKVIALQVQITGIKEAIAALSAVGGFSENSATAREMSAKIAQLQDLQAAVGSSISTANINSGGSTGGGGGGGSAEKKLTIGQQLSKSLKELRKTFEALRKLGVGQTEKVKGFIAGPFAPQFIEYLKSQGEEGVKMLKRQGKKFMAAYAKFQAEQSQIAKNYMQTLPSSILSQRRAANGTNVVSRRLQGMGVSADSAESILGNLPEGEMAAYMQALAKKRAGKKLTDEEKDLLKRYSRKGLRRIANQQRRFDSENYTREANTMIREETRGAETAARLRGLGYGTDMVEKLSQIPGIWQMSDDQISSYAKKLEHIMRLDPAARARELLEVNMQINDIRRQIAEIDEVEPLQKELDSLNKVNEAYSRKIDLLSRQLTAYDDSISKVDEERDAINKAYDERIKSLEKVENVNKRISDQQQAQLNIAAALSRGDIAAAAEAMLQAQQANAQDRLQDTKDAIERSRENELLVKEQAINAIKAQRKVIEDQIKALQAEQLVNQDLIYEKQLKLNDVTSRLADAYNNSALQRQQLLADLNEAIRLQTYLNSLQGNGSSAPAPVAFDNSYFGYNVLTGPTLQQEAAVNASWDNWSGINLDFGLGNVLSFAKGGWVPGMGNKDTTRLMAMPGEFIVNKPAAAVFGPLLEAMNANVFPSLSAISPSVPKIDAAAAGIQYNYGDINVNVLEPGASADEIGDAIIYKIQRTADRQIKGVRI